MITASSKRYLHLVMEYYISNKNVFYSSSKSLKAKETRQQELLKKMGPGIDD